MGASDQQRGLNLALAKLPKVTGYRWGVIFPDVYNETVSDDEIRSLLVALSLAFKKRNLVHKMWAVLWLIAFLAGGEVELRSQSCLSMPSTFIACATTREDMMI